MTGHEKRYDTALARLIKESGVKPAHVAAYAEVSKPTMVRFMSGERTPRLDAAERIRKFLSDKLLRELTVAEVFD